MTESREAQKAINIQSDCFSFRFCFLFSFPLQMFLNRGYIAQSGWTTEGSEFESVHRQEFSFLHVVQTGSGTHPTSYSMGNGGFFPGGEVAGA
jgi:hypothetical protein